MAEIDFNATPSVGTLINRLYDVQALVQCVTNSLDEMEDDRTIRVLRHADAITQEVINNLDLISLKSPEVLNISELVRSGGVAS